MIHDLKIRYAAQSDAGLIRKLALAVWPQTYASIISQQQIDYMLNMMYSETSLQAQMQENQFIIASRDGADVAFASFGPVAEERYKLHKIYVLPSEQGKGTGKHIIEHIATAVKKTGAHVLELNVNRNNPAADFYKKLGFAIARIEDIDIGNGFFMNDYVMEKNL